MEGLKLFMLLLGSKAAGRHVEQHDFFFGIAASLKELVPEIKAFWEEAGDSIHIDGWREVTCVEDYTVNVVPLNQAATLSEMEPRTAASEKLFFINLGGYLPGRFEEQHYPVLTVKPDKASAFRTAKSTGFYWENQFEGARSHIDDKYGIDVDDLYQIEEVLSPAQKEKYRIELTLRPELAKDSLNMGYLQLKHL